MIPGRPDAILPNPRAKLAEKFRAGWRYWVLCGLLGLAFLTGGSARADTASLAVLRPCAILALGLGLMGLSRKHLRDYRLLVSLAAAALVLPALQLVPMPPAIATGGPGHGLIADIDRAVGIERAWRPLSVAPTATRNALWAMALPAAVLLLSIQLTVCQRLATLSLVLALGAASAILGLLQILGEPGGCLYLYEITNEGSAVGLFANRNHQALLLACLLPMLAVWTRFDRQDRGGAWRSCLTPRIAGSFFTAAFVIPLILVTGSRAGMLAALISLFSLPLLVGLRQDRQVRRGNDAPAWKTGVACVAALAGLVALTIWLDRAEAVNRLLASSPADEMRLRILPTLRQMIAAYFPLGSGLGSFEQAYQLNEPDALLMPSYMNHAHNDWLELALTAGLPGILIATVAVAAGMVRTIRLFGARMTDLEPLLARLGLIVLLLIGLASLSDYPLRVPSLACLATLAAVWAGAPFNGPDRRTAASCLND